MSFALAIMCTAELPLPLAVSAAGNDAAADFYSAPTQGGLDACAADELDKADAQLNRVQHAIRLKYADQPKFLARLKSTQKAWLAFRDVEIAAIYPVADNQDPQVEYGSVYPMCVSQARTRRLTEQRTAQLQVWLDGIKDGDVCAGWVKRPDELGKPR